LYSYQCERSLMAVLLTLFVPLERFTFATL